MGKLKTITRFRYAYLVPAVLLMGGCRICADCEDAAYPAYGGVWQRTIRDSGRVGSLFDPAGAKAFDLAARDEPEGEAEHDRQNYKERGSRVTDPDETDDETDSSDGRLEEDKLRDREDELRDRKLEDIDNPMEQEQRERQLDEIDVRIIRGSAAPPIL